MKQILISLFCLAAFCTLNAQGITLLYTGPASGNWDNPVNWIEINAPQGQSPIQRIPTQLDDVIFSKSMSGLSGVTIGLYATVPLINVGGNTAAAYRCRSLQVRGIELTFQTNPTYNVTLAVSTNNGGFVKIDSGSIFRYGYFILNGGNPDITDLEVRSSTFGSLLSSESWSSITIGAKGKASLVESTMTGENLSILTGGKLEADRCTFFISTFNMSAQSFATISNTSFETLRTILTMRFHIASNANFQSTNVDIRAHRYLDFVTSGSELNGNVTVFEESNNSINFNQLDPANPLPNIINGDLILNSSSTLGIMGDLKISGNIVNTKLDYMIYPNNSHVFVKDRYAFKMGGITNYRQDVEINQCLNDYCHFKLEFFGSTNTYISWPVAFPIDTLIINKSGCAKVTSEFPLYVSGEARIKKGQLVLHPNDTIAYKMVCRGNLTISEGGGLLLAKNAAGISAKIAVDGNLTDSNTVADSTCTGFTNPYNGGLTLYRNKVNAGNKYITVMHTNGIGNLELMGDIGSGFVLGHNLTIHHFNFTNALSLLLENYNLVVTGNITHQ